MLNAMTCTTTFFIFIFPRLTSLEGHNSGAPICLVGLYYRKKPSKQSGPSKLCPSLL